MTVTVKRNIESSFRLAPLGQIWSLNQIRSVLIEIRTFCRPKVLLEYADHGNSLHTLYKTWYAFALRIFCWLLFFHSIKIAMHSRNRSTHSKSQYTFVIAILFQNREVFIFFHFLRQKNLDEFDGFWVCTTDIYRYL